MGTPILRQWPTQDVAVNQEGEGFLWASHPRHLRNEENSVNSPKAPRPLSLSRETESATWSPALGRQCLCSPDPRLWSWGLTHYLLCCPLLAVNSWLGRGQAFSLGVE